MPGPSRRSARQGSESGDRKAATAEVKAADAAKTTADKLVNDLTAKSAAKDATFIVYSNPIRIRVKEVAKK